MKFLVFVISAVFLTSFAFSEVQAQSSKFTESLVCQANSQCTSLFDVPKGAKVTLTISVETPESVDFGVRDPNGDNVRLQRAAFPDAAGMTQVFYRTMTADVGGEYTFYIRPEPQSYSATFTASIEGARVSNVQEIPAATQPKFEGGCLIATATYGSELAPQVQMLREIRDNSLLQTKSGQSFMESFNGFYYTFSPHVADFERKNPAFKEAVKVAITPMISSLSILNHVELDSEESVLGYGISLILLNLGMYVAAPAIFIVKIKKVTKSRLG